MRRYLIAFILSLCATAHGQSTTSIGPYPDARPGVLSPTYELPALYNISGVDPHPLVYQGFNGKIMPNYLSWFSARNCATSNGGIGGWSLLRQACYGTHVLIGNSGTDKVYIHADLNDIVRRKFDGIFVTWEGVYATGTNTFKDEEITTQNIAADILARCTGTSCPFLFAIQVDNSSFLFSTGFAGAAGPVQGSFAPHAATSLTANTAADVQNFTALIEDDLCYANLKYFGSPAYLRVNNRPVWQVFIGESGTAWGTIWTNVGTFNQNLATNCASFSSVYANSPNNGSAWIELNGLSGTGNAHDGISLCASCLLNGEFSWDNSLSLGVSNQTGNVSSALNTQSTFYTNKQNVDLSTVMGAAWPGFDDQLASWSPNASPACAAGSQCVQAGRVQDRNCGMTWVNSMNQAGSFFGVGHQLPFVQVITWNDFDEGSVIQTGIDNCFSLAATISGQSVNWTLTPTQSAASLQTIDHMTVYGSLDGVNLGVLVDNVTPQLTGSVNLAQLNLVAGTYAIMVKAFGKNSITNRFASAGTITVQGTAPTPIGPINPGGQPNPGPYPGYLANTSTWLATQQNLDGSIDYNSTTIVPRAANIAARGWLVDRTSISRVLNYVKWYVANLNASDIWGIKNTIYDYQITSSSTGPCVSNPCSAGSTDSYAATFLSLVWALWQTGDSTSRAYIRSIASTLDSIGVQVLLNQQQSDGLFFNFPGSFGTLKLTINNAEDCRGLTDMQFLMGSVSLPIRAQIYQAAATNCLAGLQNLYNPLTGQWYVSETSSGVLNAANLRSWNPDMVSQFWPVVMGDISGASQQATNAYSNLNAIWPNWPNLSFASDPSDANGAPWTAVGLFAADMSDTARAATYLGAINQVYNSNGFPAPFTDYEAGFALLTDATLMGQVIQGAGGKPVSTTGLGPFGTVTSPNSGNILPPNKKKNGITVLGDH